jgi:hypothetical protein
MKLPIDDPTIAASFKFYNHAPQHAYVYHVQRQVLIEPTLGYATLDDNHIILESMPYSWHGGLPSFATGIHALAQGRRHVQFEPRLISLRDFGDDNYYHFYNDVLAKLGLLQACGMVEDLPLLVSRALFEKRYFQVALQRSSLRNRRWIVQDTQLVVANEIVFCKTMPHIKRNFDVVLDLLGVPPPPSSEQRIFLTRNPRRGRFLANSAEVERICRMYGFSVIDADELTLDEQIALFGAARYVIGIHGAGLVNLMFRQNAPLGLLELFPPDNLPPHYFWLCHNFGFAYHALRGAPDTNPRGFFVEPSRLHAKIEMLVDTRQPIHVV